MKKGANGVQIPLTFGADNPRFSENHSSKVLCFHSAKANKESALMRGQEQDIVSKIVSATRRFDW